MSSRYFDLSDEVGIADRWHLGNPEETRGHEVEDPWSFTEGRRIPEPGPLSIPVKVPGRALDFTLAGLAIPVVHGRVAAVLARLAPSDVQMLPVTIPGQSDPFFVVVATRLIRCIDDRASRFVERWTPEDDQPDKVGEYRNVRDMRIDKTAVAGTQVFRPWGWNVALVVSGEIKDALEEVGTTGCRFVEV